jgi:hypothetical protein
MDWEPVRESFGSDPGNGLENGRLVEDTLGDAQDIHPRMDRSHICQPNKIASEFKETPFSQQHITVLELTQSSTPLHY